MSVMDDRSPWKTRSLVRAAGQLLPLVMFWAISRHNCDNFQRETPKRLGALLSQGLLGRCSR